MRLKISHKTSYLYDSPVHYALQQLRLRPLERPGLEVIDWTLHVDGGTQELSFRDQHENHVDLVRIEPGRCKVVITCEGEIRTADDAGVIGRHRGFTPLWLFQRSTDLTKPGPGLRKLVRELDHAEDDRIGRLHALSREILNRVAYGVDKTHAQTTAEDAVQAGHGVCQDHAHIFVAAARLMGFPARYVSGYLMMPGQVEQDASHAWAEAHVEDVGWIGFDVSNGISPDDHYVAIATGLDYKEAAPISGLRLGDAGEALEVALRVEQ